MFGLAVVWPRSANISKPDSSTKSISLLARFSSAPANIFSPTSIRSRWATTAPNTLPLLERCTAFSRSDHDAAQGNFCPEVGMSISQDIKSRLDIVDVVSEYVQLRKSGNSYSGFC